PLVIHLFYTGIFTGSARLRGAGPGHLVCDFRKCESGPSRGRRHNFGLTDEFLFSFEIRGGRVMRRSIVSASCAPSPPHVVVIGTQKGGSGKSTFAMHIIVALLKAGKRVASFDLDLNQLTLTRYLGNRHEWVRKHEQKLELPDHYPVTEQVHGTTLVRFISRLKKIGRAHKDDFTG